MYSLSSVLIVLLLLLSLFRSLLRSNEVQRDPRQYEQVVQKVIAYMTLGVDVSGLFREMIMVSRAERGCVRFPVYQLPVRRLFLRFSYL